MNFFHGCRCFYFFLSGIICSAAFANSPIAEEPNISKRMFSWIGMPYVALQAGVGQIEIGDIHERDKAQFKGNVLRDGNSKHPELWSGRMGIGYFFWENGYKFKLGSEIGCATYPSITQKTHIDQYSSFNKITGNYIDFLIVGQGYLIGNLSAFFKIGGAVVTQKEILENMESNIIIEKRNKTKSSLLPTVSIGLAYDIKKNIEATLTYSYTNGCSIIPKFQLVEIILCL